jgi:hypothetical protein
MRDERGGGAGGENPEKSNVQNMHIANFRVFRHEYIKRGYSVC